MTALPSNPSENIAYNTLPYNLARRLLIPVKEIVGQRGLIIWTYLLGIMFIAAGTYGLLRGFRILKAKFCD